jgi:hypothetical protein
MRKLLFLVFLIFGVGRLQAQNIVSGEYFFDTEPGLGSGIPLTGIVPGQDITYSPVLSLSGLSRGHHTIFLRFRDQTGKWSHTVSQAFYIKDPDPDYGNTTYGEYYIDTDPGRGTATPVTSFVAGKDIAASALHDLGNLPPGPHLLTVRFRNSLGVWSDQKSLNFYVYKESPTVPSIKEGEYFIDADPGRGNGTGLKASVPGTDIKLTASYSLQSLSTGYHRITFRSKNVEGKWSHQQSQLFYVYKIKPPVLPTEGGEYFIGKDPGPGKGKMIVLASSLDTSFAFTVPASEFNLSDKFYSINFRARDIAGHWGFSGSQQVFIEDGLEKYYTAIQRLTILTDSVPSKADEPNDSINLTVSGVLAHSSYDHSSSPVAVGRHYLFVRGEDIFRQASAIYDSIKYIATTDTSTGMLLGQVYQPDSSIAQSGTIQIYSVTDTLLSLFSDAEVDQRGGFLLGEVPAGDYLLLMQPDQQISPLAITTYYELAPQWEIGKILGISKSIPFFDIVFRGLKGRELTGTAIISGSITTDDKKSIGIEMNPGKVKGNPVKKAGVIIVGRSKSPGNVFAQTYTDDLGLFHFENIPEGSFDILVDILGIPLLNYYSVDVSSSTSSITDLDYLVGTGGIYHPGQIANRKNDQFLLYPNPAGNFLNLLFSGNGGKIEILIVDISGKPILNRHFTINTGDLIGLDITGIPAGFYVLKVSSGNIQTYRTFIHY